MLRLRLFLVVAGGCAVLGLAGCGSDLSRTFGLTRDAPDEFMVTTRAPLSMPPDYSLRPPEPGAPRPQELSPRRAAEADLAPQTALSSANTASETSGEQALLQAAGPPAPADIRQKVNAEAAQDSSGISLTDRLMFWKKTPTPGVAIDPQKEAERLRTDAALGQSPDRGPTPIIQEHHSIWNWF